MKNYSVKKYQPSDYLLWNEFVAVAKNATFLFHRDFMEYHNDRFEDFSLLVFDEKGKIKAVMPANRVGNTVYSHQGLTYGGLVVEKSHNPINTPILLDSILNFIKKESIKEVFIKIIPTIYCKSSSQDFDYYLLKKGGQLFHREMNLIVDLKSEWNLSKSKLKHFKKVENFLELREDYDFSNFWNNVLVPRLQEKYKTAPVHNLAEIEKLKRMFDSNIKQYSAFYNDKIVAGVTIFMCNQVVKSQYGIATNEGEQLRALDFIFIKLIQKYKNEGQLIFDMGTVGTNEGLLNQKVELGCAVINNDIYQLEI